VAYSENAVLVKRGSMKKTRLAGAFLAASALFLVACEAEEDGENTGANKVVEDADNQTPSENPADPENPAGANGNETGESNEDGGSDEFASSLECDTPYDGPAADLEKYSDVYLETNFQLEQLVTEIGDDYSQYSSGELGDEELVANLEEHSHRYSEITAGALAIGPPEQAAQWHANAVESWVRICEALTDAHEGIVNDDSGQFVQFEKALNDDPNLLNDLHANTMVGPGETA